MRGRKAGLKLPKDIIVVGVEPKVIEAGLELSPEVKKAARTVVDLIAREAYGVY